MLIKSRTYWQIDLKELWSYRELFYFLVWRDIKVRYKQTVLGILWAVLQPVLTMVIFTFLFNRVLHVSSGEIPYAVFSFTGLIFWNYFSTSLSDVSNSFVANQSIVTKVFFPRLIIPIAATITPLIDFFFSLIVLIGLMVFFKVSIHAAGFLFLIPSLLMSVVTTIGLGSILSIVNVKYRDVRYALPFFIQLLLFVSPVIYSIHQVPKNMQLLLYLNPITGVIEFMRSVLFSNYALNFSGVIISCISSTVLLLLGVIVFLRFEREIADTL